MFFKFTLKIWNRNKMAFVFRLLGLTMSLSFLILILAYILNELSYDNHIDDRNTIYRVLSNSKMGEVANALTPFPLKSVIVNNVPEVDIAFRYSRIADVCIRKGKSLIPEHRFYCADNEIFNLLNIKVLYGNYSNFNLKYNIAISQRTSQKYFNTNNTIGRVLVISQGGKDIHATVVAIFENIPKNSTFNADIIGNFQIKFDLINLDYNELSLIKSLDKFFFTTYIKLNDRSNKTSIEKKINQIINNTTDQSDYQISLQCLNNLYFGSGDIRNNFQPIGSSSNVKLFSIISIIILVIAISNFIIISSLLHQYRKKEYSIRMINGASRIDILLLISAEIVLLIIISFILSIILSNYLLPFATNIFQKQILVLNETHYQFISVLLAILASIGIITILIVSIYIFNRGAVKTKYTATLNELPFFKFNKLLVLVQIGIFSGLIVISSLLVSQWQYLKKSSVLGFEIENLIVLKLPRELSTNSTTFINTLRNNPQIINITESFNIPLVGPFTNSIVFNNGDYTKKIKIESLTVGDNFFKTLNINIANGREFDLAGNYDIDKCIMLNEAAVKFLQINDPIGKTVAWREVIGIVSNFQMHSMYHKIEPLLIYPRSKVSIFVLIRFVGKRADIIKFVKNKQAEILPSSNFDIDNYTSIINDTYKHENRLKRIFSIFTLIAVILGVVGIFGLLTFTVQKRSKEIKIRIIHGATILNIVALLTKEFFIVLIISNIITYPLIWYFVNEWLNQFEYHTDINIMFFFLATLSTLLIIMFSVFLVIYRYNRKSSIKYINE